MRRHLSVLAASALVASTLLIPSNVATAGVQLPPECDLDAQEPTGTFMSGNVQLKCAIVNPGVIGANFKEYEDGKTYMFVTSLSGLHVYDVTNPAKPKPAGALSSEFLPHFENEDVDLGGNMLMISNDAAESTGLLWLIDISDPTDPVPIYEPPVVPNYPFHMGGNPIEGGPGHTASCINGCNFAWITNGAAIDVYDLRDAKHGEGPPVLMGTMETGAGGRPDAKVATHDVQKDGNGLYWVAGFGGTFAYDVPSSDNYEAVEDAKLVVRTDRDGDSTYFEELGLGDGGNPNDYIHHNSRRLKNESVVYITEEDYTRPGCRGAGSFQTWKIPMKGGRPDRTKQVQFLDQWQTELIEDQLAPAGVCSAHYFDIAGSLVAQGWYEQGTRFLDVSDPRNIKQVGFYMPPRTMTWASYYIPTDNTKSFVYTLDALRGIDVLKVDRSARNRKTAPIRQKWLQSPDELSSFDFTTENGEFGWACRLSNEEVVWPLP